MSKKGNLNLRRVRSIQVYSWIGAASMPPHRAKYSLITRVIAWLVVAAIIGGASFSAWRAIAEGKTLRVIITVTVLALATWAISRDAGRAKNR